jgi:hypothetical protein
MFQELLNDRIKVTDLTDTFKNLDKKLVYVSTFLQEYVENEELENWELKSPVATLIESYYCLLQLKRLVSAILMEPKTSSTKILKFKESEKLTLKIYIGNLMLTKKTLKDKFSLFLESVEYC